jgi:hypothetical protein
MSGKMRKRQRKTARAMGDGLDNGGGLYKSFHAPQKDNSKRAKKNARLNNYKQEK